MAVDSLVSSLTSRSTTSPADRKLKAELQEKYVKELWFFLAAVIALLACIRAGRYICSIIFKPKPLDLGLSNKNSNIEAIDGGQTGKLSLRRLPAAFSSAFRIVAFRYTIPIGPSSVASISELVFICGYMVAIFVWLLVNTRDLQTAFYEDRAAHFASCQLPLIVALAGKNNIICFLTGISHERLNVLHRAAARTCLVLLWMHAIARTVVGLPAMFDFSHNWMRYGATGLTAFSLASFFSIRPIRQMAFEFFLISHIILVAIFLVCGFLHARNAGFGNYIWPALVIWALDRTLRFGGLIWNNNPWGMSGKSTAATVELLSEDTIRLTLQRKFRWKAGQHAYVLLPTVSNLPTEAHPFTIASIPDGYDGVSEKGKEIIFLIRGRSGFTGRLRNHASRAGFGTVPAYIDGPYGCPPDLRTFSTCVLIAGGSGVSYTTSLLKDIIRNARARHSITRRVIFLWAVRHEEHFKWIAKVLSEALDASPSSLAVELRVHVTQSIPPTEDLPALNPGVDIHHVDFPPSPSSSISVDKEITLEPPVSSAVKLMRGRPNIQGLLEEEISTALGPVSVDVAGPSALAQSVRTSLCFGSASPLSVLNGAPTVTLHVETFGMVKG